MDQQKPAPPAKKSHSADLVERFASLVTKAAGSAWAFIIAFMVVLIWGISGPIFHYSENWQLIINTGTTIITFLMVFLIQKAQNKDSLAIQLKLNELVAAHEFASNRLVNVENMTEKDLKLIQKYYSSLSDMSKKEESLQQSHSIDEASNLSEIKKGREDIILDELEVEKKKP
jgi:low affinity Fe/Cu permease